MSIVKPMVLCLANDWPTVLAALENASDHLPVVADYSIVSPICANSPAADLSGDCNKINESDLGALSEQWLVPCYQCSQVDIYIDGKINFKDYSLLSANWLKKGPSLAGDITRNGIVDMLDLKVMLFHWLTNCQ